MASKEIRAEISGTIISIVAKKGDAVADGDTIAIIEAMKMEIPVLSQTAGTLTEMRCAEGDVVAENALLALVEA